MHVGALVGRDTLRLCMSERLTASRPYTYAYASAHEPPDTTPMHVGALVGLETMHRKVISFDVEIGRLQRGLK